MSRIKDVKRQLDTACEAVEALDAELAAGRLPADEHRRQRIEREAEIGRLFVTLRRWQREARAQAVEAQPVEPPPAAAGPGPGWRRRPALIVPAALLLVVVGVGAGVALGRRFTGSPETGRSTASSPPGAPAATSLIELQVLRQEAARQDAPIPTLLQLGHLALDGGRLDEARQVYERVLAREPRNAEAITHLGGVLFQEKRVDEALARVEEALRIDPRYIHALWDRTQYLFHGKRDFPAALKAAEAFLAVAPDGPDAETVRRLAEEARRQGAAGGPRAR